MREREEGVVAIHQPIGSLKTHSGLDQYRDANQVPTSPLADDVTTAPLGPVVSFQIVSHWKHVLLVCMSSVYEH